MKAETAHIILPMFFRLKGKGNGICCFALCQTNGTIQRLYQRKKNCIEYIINIMIQTRSGLLWNYHASFNRNTCLVVEICRIFTFLFNISMSIKFLKLDEQLSQLNRKTSFMITQYLNRTKRDKRSLLFQFLSFGRFP